MSKLVFAAFLLLSFMTAWAGEPAKDVPKDAPKQEQPCQRDGDRISCSEAGFKTLTDALIEFRGSEEKWNIRHQACVVTRDAAEASLTACAGKRLDAEARLAAIKPPSVLRPVLAVTGAVLGAVALTSALTLNVPPQVRLGLGAGGLAGIAAGFVFVLPERITP